MDFLGALCMTILGLALIVFVLLMRHRDRHADDLRNDFDSSEGMPRVTKHVDRNPDMKDLSYWQDTQDAGHKVWRDNDVDWRVKAKIK